MLKNNLVSDSSMSTYVVENLSKKGEGGQKGEGERGQ